MKKEKLYQNMFEERKRLQSQPHVDLVGMNQSIELPKEKLPEPKKEHKENKEEPKIPDQKTEQKKTEAKKQEKKFHIKKKIRPDRKTRTKSYLELAGLSVDPKNLIGA